MSKIIVVDKNDIVIGPMDRDEATAKELIQRIVRIFVFDEKERVYLQRRSKGKEIFPDTWDPSASGHVDEGETYIIAAKRELKEEVGIQRKSLTRIVKYYSDEVYKDLHIRMFNVLYTTELHKDTIRLNEREVSRGAWFYPQKVDEMIRKAPKEFATGCITAWKKYRISMNR